MYIFTPSCFLTPTSPRPPLSSHNATGISLSLSLSPTTTTTTSSSNSQPPPTNSNPSPSPTTITSGSNSQPPPPTNSSLNPTKTGTSFRKVVAENAVIVFGLRGCCMCHVVKCLLVGLGVNPPVVEVDEHEKAAVIDELSEIGHGGIGDGGQGLQFPAVFVRGKLFGGLERVMATHISGELVPMLKDAGALWL
ncbi:thioredoxin superfamily protein [Actinidia rufa]|uniref:Thioredoxin superfamily protein n=1 Tax=Actinidia rufa TaxID=165716 RepID=A0A7J0F0B2_9ERIC|nr:thioredoxin superfamily protein [Actinidia rufa]